MDPETERLQEELRSQIAEAKKTINEVKMAYETFLSAAELDPQIVRTLQQVLGGTTLSSLADVDLSSPSNGQVLKYRSSDKKWYNGNDDIGSQ